ncbi:MAG TPA: LysR substrate-binding domain-containing protein [Chloroflexota bacterium]|nr:LysR substrate-binding domain-containing protein [Chloroflexota bacterium]
MTELNFHQLRIFYMVAQLRSFSRAARQLAISQPAVSAQVRQFEEDLGLVLVDRTKHRVGLTDAGRSVAAYAQRIFGMSDELAATIDRLHRNLEGHLTIGASPTIGEYLLPQFLAQYRRHYPSVTIRVDIAPTRVIGDRLRARELQLGFAVNPEPSDEFEARPFASDELLLVGPPGHPLLGAQSAGRADLAAMEFVMGPSTSSLRRAAEARLAELNVAPRVVLEVGSSQAIKQAVMANIGVGVLSEAAVRLELEMGRLGSIGRGGFNCQRQLCVLVPKAEEIGETARGLLEIVLPQRADERETGGDL